MRASDVKVNLLRRGGNSNKTDCRRRRKSLDGTDKNLIILQQDALFYLLSHGFAKFRMINFVYQKSDIRICGRCECLDPPLNIQESLLECLFSLPLWQIPRETYLLQNFESYFFTKLRL